MDKEEKLYEKEYGDVPFPANERLMYLLKKIHYKKQKTSVYDLMELYQSIKWKTQTFIICEVPKATPRPRTNLSFAIITLPPNDCVIFIVASPV